MDLALIEKLMRLLESSDLQELDVNDGGTRIRLAKKRSGGAVPEAEPAIAAAEPPLEAPKTEPIAHRIIAGMAGTFYRAPSPGAPPFVTEGMEIRDGQQLAIIEAMKMLNPVEADTDGVIVRILLEDGGSVSPGMALFEVEPKMNEALRRNMLEMMNRHGIGVLEYEGPDGSFSLDAERSIQAHAKIFADSPGVFLSRHPADSTEPVWPRPVRPGEIIGWLKVGPLLKEIFASEHAVLSRPIARDGSLVGYRGRIF